MLLANRSHPILIEVIPLWAAPIICGGLLAEAFIARRKFGLSNRSTVLAVLAVNIVTAMLALPILLFGTELLYPVEEMFGLPLNFNSRIFAGVPSYAIAYCLTTLINTAVEVAMLRHIWKVPSSMHPFRWWLLANATSNGLAFAALIVLLWPR
ncbi:MAG: hypothetical protein EXS10_08180 [Phycisphaerales bacterium]|nr:hypothetical protein [Phycisphaerales bacterium]